MKRSGGALARLAGMWCSNPEFWSFLAKRFDRVCTDKDEAAAIVREVCGVASRADLDSVPAAEAHFHVRIRLPFMRWTQGVRDQHQCQGKATL